tara:strand:+ start:235 stop:438 length:204 start_codon:yes stop_codon:yes gene_type:complete
MRQYIGCKRRKSEKGENGHNEALRNGSEFSLRRISAGIKRRVDRVIFNKFKLFDLSPSFIITARRAS